MFAHETCNQVRVLVLDIFIPSHQITRVFVLGWDAGLGWAGATPRLVSS